mmetsp:Transcript_56884/g.94583  ORF Transcript_56884/g.94583 Transcript_56884/m.94583 type:complete len:286 (-) Transcript_56884:161-1018(-)
MFFQFLKLVIGTEIRITILKSDHHSDENLSVGAVINKTSAVHIQRGGIAQTMHHQPWAVMRIVLGNLPHFFESNAIDLWVTITAEIERFHHLLRDAPATTFRQNGLSAENGSSAFKVRTNTAVFEQTKIRGCDTNQCIALCVIEWLTRTEPRQYHHIECLRLFTQPSTQLTQRDDIVAIVAEIGWNEWRRDTCAFAQIPKFVLGHCLMQWCALFFPVWNEFIQRNGIEHIARHNVRSNFSAFLHHTHFQLSVMLLRQLFEFDGGRETSRTTANNHHIKLHRLAFR